MFIRYLSTLNVIIAIIFYFYKAVLNSKYPYKRIVFRYISIKYLIMYKLYISGTFILRDYNTI